jgi:hypothetical protein
MAATALPEPEQPPVAAALDTTRSWHVPSPTANAIQSVGGEADVHQRWVRAANTFLALVDGLPAELRERPGACGAWSVREVVAHCAGWEWEAARRLRLIAADPTLPEAHYEVDRFNGASVAARARQDWSRTLDELEKASATLAKAAAALPDDARTRKWLLGRATDFEEHTAALERWLADAGSRQAPHHAGVSIQARATQATL